MEEYSDIKIDTSDKCDTPRTLDAISATMQAQEYDQAYLMSYPGIEIEKSKADKLRVLRQTCGNGVVQSRLKAKQESCVTTQADKSAEVIIKLYASQELQTEKEKMEIWKVIVIQKMAWELQNIRRVEEELMEAQRQSFQAELDRLKKMGNKKSKLFEDKISLQKN